MRHRLATPAILIALALPLAGAGAAGSEDATTEDAATEAANFFLGPVMMMASVRMVSPGAEIHLLTLDSCAVPGGLDCDLVFLRASNRPIEASFDRLMAEETETWRAYEAAGHLSGPTLLIDADLMFQRDPFALFDGGFDVGLTYVTGAELHPFNSGVILIDPTRRGVAGD